MIVLDEQLMGRDLDVAIRRWYRGAVHFIHELRPGTVIKDDTIPILLRRQRQPTFVTINERDFWRRVSIDPSFCIACFDFPDSQLLRIPDLLRMVFQLPDFHTKELRMGCVLRVSNHEVSYYRWNDQRILRRQLTSIDAD